ncbi:MAG: ankyrin repeat domain-containing protein [Candidatus Aminicenantes bacterium]|nr:ankyrin repeat domain-containing protein [Candidatus Aminicenantes bacterium]
MRKIILSCILIVVPIVIHAQSIFEAIRANDLEKIREMVEKNPQLVNKRGPNNYTPILFAANNDKIDIVEYLLSKGANIDDVFTDYYGYTPLIYAIQKGNLDMVRMLVKRGANIQYRTKLGENYLHFAAAYNRVKIASTLINCGICIDSTKKGGLTPLHISALFGNPDMAKLLAKKGANLDVRSKDGGTALHYAIAARHDDVAAFLRREGAKDKARKFPLYRGQYLGRKEPGTVPKLFLPELFLEIYRTYSAPAFSPDGKEVFWMGYIMPGVQGERIWWMREKNGRWTPPEVAPFSRFRSSSPAFSHDGKKLFFAAWGPVDGKIPRDSDLWVVEKRGNGWGEPRHLGFPPNKKGVYETYPIPARDGTIYFNAFGGGTRNTGTGMYKSKYANGTYTEKLSLDGLFDADILDDCSVMDYMIFHTPHRTRSYGSQLFVCFHQSDGIWTRPIYLGDLFHQGLASNFGKISPNDKYFFFLQDIALYWVDATIIEELRPKE